MKISISRPAPGYARKEIDIEVRNVVATTAERRLTSTR
jgi:hypothetical protein